ncbi:enoyl-CoA hydratase/isomerase family protein [Luminiphilus sp. nBUS_07]|uniref:enoyl-CoA hydratase/isomerase family protein n=1 Tax=Luminiphilus sp. nBUS_07 TaxID=3395314 RepID=UPI003EBF5750
MSKHYMILASQEGRVCTITLNRPDDLNPLSWQVLGEIENVLDDALHDDSIGVIVIEAAGKAFSTGYDLREEHWITSQYPANFPDHVDIRKDRDDVHTIVDYWMKMWRYPKPIIAKVQGDCLSGAGELLGVCDLAVVSERARFGHPAGRDLGIPPSIMFWPMLIGYRKTKELLYTSRLINAHEAEKIGLINEVVAHEDLDARVALLAAHIARAPSDNLSILKEVSNTWFENMGMEPSVRRGADLDAIYHQFDSFKDFFQTLRKEGVKAAFKKRRELYG